MPSKDSNLQAILMVSVKGRVLRALIDSGATDNFISARALPHGTVISPTTLNKAQLAMSGAEMALMGSCTLNVRIADICTRASFFIATQVRHDMILGRRWLKQQKVIHDHHSDCLYILSGEGKCTIIPLAAALVHPIIKQQFCDQLKHDFPEELVGQLKKLVLQHYNVFDDARLSTKTNLTKHEIRMKNQEIVNLPAHQYSAKKKKIFDRLVQQMLEDGVIEAAPSPYNSPAVLVMNKDETVRFCVDFRKVNEHSEDSVQPHPIGPEILKKIDESQIYSTIDLQKCWWQIPLAEDSKKYSAFSAPDGKKYVFNVAAYSLGGSRWTCGSLIANQVLVGLVGDFCLVSEHEIIIMSKTWEEHLKHIGRVLRRLDAYEISCALDKCKFGKSHLNIPTHLITTRQAL